MYGHFYQQEDSNEALLLISNAETRDDIENYLKRQSEILKEKEPKRSEEIENIMNTLTSASIDYSFMDLKRNIGVEIKLKSSFFNDKKLFISYLPV